MSKLIKECMPWLNWQTGIIGAAVLIGVVACTGLPKLSALAGAAPLLIVAACLLPCLLPLVLLRRNKADKATATLSDKPE